MITTPIFTRLMSTSEYGNYNVFNSWLGIITIISSMNLCAGVHTQGLIKYSDDRTKFTSSLLDLTTILILCWVIIYLVFKVFWNNLLDLETIQMISMFTIIWSNAVFGFWANAQRINYSYKKLVLVTIIISLLQPALGILLVIKLDNKVTARILGLAITGIAGYSWIYFRRLIHQRPLLIKKYWKYALNFNIPLIPHYLSQVVLNSADRIMIKSMVGENQAGIYSLAYSLSQIMVIFNTAITQTLSPWMYQKIKEKKEGEIAPVAYICLCVIAFVNILLILFAPEVVAVFAPKAYYEAIWTIPPVALSCFFMFSYDLFAKYAFYYEKTKFIMLASISGAVLNIILNLIFIKQYGYIAAGYTTLACYMIYSLIHYCFMRKVCSKYGNKRYPYDTKIILLIIVPFVGIGLLLISTYNHPYIRYGLILIIMLAIIIMRKKILETLNRVFSINKKA